MREVRSTQQALEVLEFSAMSRELFAAPDAPTEAPSKAPIAPDKERQPRPLPPPPPFKKPSPDSSPTTCPQIDPDHRFTTCSAA